MFPDRKFSREVDVVEEKNIRHIGFIQPTKEQKKAKE
jgi:hypothetical protein